MTQSLGMAPGLSSLVMYIGTGALSGQTTDDTGIFNAMATASPLNAQLSCSWGWTPPDPTTDDVYFEEFAAQGQNLFMAAGDDGMWRSGVGFYWPAESAYVTTVGGTSLTTTAAGGAWASETGWEDTGGGISPDDYAIPSWQVATAALCANCSQTYRNGPDVSANADFTYYVCADQTACTANVYGGTTFSTPIWAGYMALVNEQTVLYDHAPLGFINPALYTIGLGADYDLDFHDITTGGNNLGTTVGFDLSTGWGSPYGRALVDALAGSPGSGTITITTAASATVAYSSSNQVVLLSAMVATGSGTVNVGTVTFAVLNGATPVGTSVTSGTVTGGNASANYTVPGGTAIGTYTIKATYNPGGAYNGSSDSTRTLTVGTIPPQITWTPATTIIFGSSGTNVLNASSTVAGSFTYTASPPTPAEVITSTAGLGPFLPTYTVTANFTPSDTGEYSSASESITLTVSEESVWIVDGSGGTSELAGNGYGITSTPYTGANASLALDNAGNVWSAGTGPTLLEETSQIGTQPVTPSGGGLDAPVGIAIDGNGQVWVTNGNGSVSEFSNGGVAISSGAGFTDSSLSTPSGIAVDLGGSVWIANKGNNSVTRILGAAAPVAPLATAAANGTTGAKP
jgi:kumamolisin